MNHGLLCEKNSFAVGFIKVGTHEDSPEEFTLKEWFH